MGGVRKAFLKRGDIVVAISGGAAARGRTGKILQVMPKRGCAVVEGFKLVKKTVRKSQDRPNGDIITKEAPIPLANLQLFCPNCKRGVRAARTRDAQGRLQRKCRKCGHEFK